MRLRLRPQRNGPIAVLENLQGPDVTADEAEQQKQIVQQEAELEKVIHQQIHSLARVFVAIDGTYKQLQGDERLRAAAAARLDAQWGYYEEGRITIDRFLDAVNKYVTAVGTKCRTRRPTIRR